MNIGLFPCLARDRKSPPQRRIVANIFGKEVDLHWRKVCSTNSVFIIRSKKNIQQSFHSGHRATLYCEGLKCHRKFATKLFTRRRIKRRNRRHSFSISLNFYQTILESSPQTRFMFDIKKLLLIDALTFIPRETQDDLLRIAIDLLEFRRIPKAGHITDYRKAESTGVE